MKNQNAELATPVGGHDHIRGPKDAPFTLLEYGDYECPFCGAAYHVVREVRQRMGEQLRFAYRHFPLVNMHPHAEHAAETAECSGAQGRFWAMHDLLFEHQDALDEEALLAYAEAIGLDLPRFEREFEAGLHASRVREDLESGLRSGVRGTPTFFINGIRHVGPHDADSLLEAIHQARQAA